MDYINDLPAELLVRIFGYYIDSQGHGKFLKNLPLVCKRWNSIHSNPSLWSDMTSYCWPPYVMDIFCEKGLLLCTQKLILEMYCDTELKKVFGYCRELKKLRLLCCSFSKASMLVLAKRCPNIVNLELEPCEDRMEKTLGPYLALRGHNLKRLKLDHGYCSNFVETIAKHCHSLEEVECYESKHNVSQRIRFAIDELVIGCPKIQRLNMSGYNVILSNVRDHNGFENMVSFGAYRTDFGGLDLCSVLKSSKFLERLSLDNCRDVKMINISKIPSDRMKIFSIEDQDMEDCPLHVLVEAVAKWRRTLTVLCLTHTLSRRDVTEVVKAYLFDNPEPKLELLDLTNSEVKTHVLKRLMRACENLQYVHASSPDPISFWDRDEIEEFCEG